MTISSSMSGALLAICCLLLALSDVTLSKSDVTSSPATGPKDYAHSTTNSRVKDLVDFFELVHRSSEIVQPSQETGVTLSLSQSASKLYTLAHGLPLEAKCNRYVKLIDMPDIRSVSLITELMKEDGQLDERAQTDANLVARLTSERKFDALARIQTIVQSLESEQTSGKSNYEPNVEKELLECVNYYVNRHQEAVSSVATFVGDSLASLPEHLIEVSESKILVEKFSQALERVESIEQQGTETQFNYQDWLEALIYVQSLAEASDYQIPSLVRDFLADETRRGRLELYHEISELANKVLSIEPQLSWFNKKAKANLAHREALQALFYLCEVRDDKLQSPEEICKMLNEPKRRGLVAEFKKDGLDKGAVEPDSAPAAVGDDDIKTDNVAVDSQPESESPEPSLAAGAEQSPETGKKDDKPAPKWVDNIFGFLKPRKTGAKSDVKDVNLKTESE